jgi:predicted dehydrogenase
MAISRLRAAVVGAGRLGGWHARKYAAIPDVKLSYIVDIDAERARALAAETDATPLSNYRELKEKVELVSIATPGLLHHRIAAELLAVGIDVLLEKPMAATLVQAKELARLADHHRRILQIGHLERFNPAIVGLRNILKAPRFIECHRLAPFTERGVDVDVVLDLMVHDLDVIISATDASPQSVEALGVAVLTDQIDVANARIRFVDGMIANVNTSRVAPRRERKIRFFQPDAYISLDYEARRIQVYRKSAPAGRSPYPTISAEQIELTDGDPLMDEISAFVHCVRTRSAPPVGPEDGLRVMRLSEAIRSSIADGGRPASIVD